MAGMTLEEEKFLDEAINHGTIEFGSRTEEKHVNRFLVTVGNSSRPFDLSDEWWVDSYPRFEERQRRAWQKALP